MLNQPQRHPQEGRLTRLSEKDLTLIKNTYRKLSQSFYEHPKQPNIDPLFCFLTIVEDVITTEQAKQTLALGSGLEVLKLKSKNCPKINKQTLALINILASPQNQVQKEPQIKQRAEKGGSVIQGLNYAPQSPQLYSLSCTLILRLSQQMPKLPVEEAVALVGTHSTVNTKISVELLLFIAQEKGAHVLKSIVKTVITKHLMKNYLIQVCQSGQKLLLYRGLKLLRLISSVDKNLVKDREKVFAQVLGSYEQYVPITKEVLANCQDEQYSQAILAAHSNSNIEWIDRVYVWSYDESFCRRMVLSTPAAVKKIQQIAKTSKLPETQQFKIYAILANLAKYAQSFSTVPIPPKHQKTIKSCLKMAVSFNHQQLQAHKEINIKALETMVERSDDPMVPKLYAQLLESLNSKQNTIKALDSALFDIYAEKNAEILIEKAGQTPNKKEDIEQLIEILARKYPKNEFEADCLHRAKRLAIESLMQCVLQNKSKVITPEMVNKTLKSLHLSDVEQVSRSMQLLEVYMLKNPEYIDAIDSKRVQQILEWLEDQSLRSRGMIDWGACGQVINILFPEDEWEKNQNFNDALDSTQKHNHRRTFWLLNLPPQLKEKQRKRIMEKLSQVNPKHPKVPLILGFLARSGGELRSLILSKNDNELIQSLFKEPQSPNIYLMLGFLVQKWSKEEQGVAKEKITKQIIPKSFNFLEKYSKFNGSSQVCKLLTQSLPMQPKFDYPYGEISLETLLNKYGKLSQSLYRNKLVKMNQGNVYDRMKALVGQTHSKERISSENINEILTFLIEAEQNNAPNISCSKEPINSSLDSLMQAIMKMDKQYCYWKLYPNYVSIISKFLKLVAVLHGKDRLTKEMVRLYEKNYHFNSRNQQLNEDQYAETTEEVLFSLQAILQNCKKNNTLSIPLNIDTFKSITEQVAQKEPQLAKKITCSLQELQSQQNEREKQFERLKKIEAQARKKQQETQRLEAEAQRKQLQVQKIEIQIKTKESKQPIHIAEIKQPIQIAQIQQPIQIAEIKQQASNQIKLTQFHTKQSQCPQQTPDPVLPKKEEPAIQQKINLFNKERTPISAKTGNLNERMQMSPTRQSSIMQDKSQLGPDAFQVSQIKPTMSKIEIPEEMQNLEQTEPVQKQTFGSVPASDSILQISAEDMESLSERELTLIEAIRRLKLINDDKQPLSLLPKLLNIFKTEEVPIKYRDILGHLLAKTYYMKQQPVILELLLRKQKTNLSKESCYDLLNKFFEAFILSRRYKLLGREWLVMAMDRVHQGCIADGCLVAEYNLIKTSDIEYFESKKYHQQLVQLCQKLTTSEDIAYYLLAVGTTCRLNDIRNYYLKNKMPELCLKLATQNNSGLHQKILANGNYAISSMLYMQPGESLKLSMQKTMMEKLFAGIYNYPANKGIVESGCCLVSNMTYNNDQVKMTLQGYKVVPMLLTVFNANVNLENSELNTFKHIIRAIGNCSVCRPCGVEIIDGKFSQMAIKMVERFDVLVSLNEEKLKVLKLTVDLLANLTVHKHHIEKLHQAGVTQFVITLLETAEINHELINGCIDTIDGLCQIPQIQSYAVHSKNLPYILIDILKMQENEKTITKATRLLTNLTIHPECIPAVLKANLLSILGNIVMLSHFNKKLQTYVNKVIVRVYNSQQPIDLILKSGYLDCLVRLMEVSETVDDTQIDIMLFYSKTLPNFLNKRAFMCMIRVLSQKPTSKQLIDKSIRIFKTLLNMSIDRDEEDLVISGSIGMYAHLLSSYPADMLYLLGSHCLRSRKLRHLLRKKQNSKIVDLINSEELISLTHTVYNNQTLVNSVKMMAPEVSFIIFNEPEPLNVFPNPSEEQTAFQVLSKGFKCKLFRVDGTSKKAAVDLNEDYVLRSYKIPDGQIKKKYTLPVRNIKDWHFYYNPKMDPQTKDLWKYSIFAKHKGFFEQSIKVQNCLTLMGGVQWGEFVSLNLQFETLEQKNLFLDALRVLMKTFAC